ncbi:MAG TPA: LamG-like jellyroll fold domain-containing protein, partial [Clostridia bacterium]|nr:LamG-like jellyroll fold domain-containing protein [Clostridia bacterium]
AYEILGDLPFFCNATNSSYNWGYTFSPSYEGGGWTWSLYSIEDSGPGVDGADYSINDGNWHHLVHTFDRAGDGITYLDGVQVDSRSIAGSLIDLDSGRPTNIGQDAYGTYAEDGRYELDDMAVWRRVLSPLEVAGLYVIGAQKGATFVSSPSVKISIQLQGNQVQLTWPSGTLQSSSEPEGGYSDVPNASSPYAVTPSQGKQFYRIRR